MKHIGNLFILGDSYSTFEGYIPDGYVAYYTNAGREETDVTAVEQTWWYELIRQSAATLVQNCSWSGTTICHTGYNGSDNADKSFVARFEKLISEGFFEENFIDTMIVFGGTNDSWSNAPLGEIVYSGWTEKQLYKVRPAIFCLADMIYRALPNTRVIFVINCGMKQEINEALLSACEWNNYETVLLRDIDKCCGHPTVKGMKQICEAILEGI